jgi:hypothetical protein
MRDWRHLFLCLLALLCLPVYARDLAAYKVGDSADADSVTPVALDIVDPAATAALRLIKSQQFPSIFRSFPDTTNGVTRDFLAAYARARTNFLADVAIEFHAATLNEPAIASADFGRLVTVFGVENKSFPITDELAAEWARGGDGHAIREKLLATLSWVEQRPVRPDALPAGMVIGETIRLVPVVDINEKFSLETVQQGPLAPATNLLTLSEAQTLFRGDFTAGQQLFGRALAAFLEPNCFPDAPFTQLTRGTAVYKVVVSDHFDAGEVIVHRGDTIDAKMKAALEALDQELALNAAKAPVAAVAPPPPQPPLPAASPAPVALARSRVLPPAKPAQTAGFRHPGIILTLASVSFASLLLAGWQYYRQKKGPSAPLPTAQVPLPFPEAAKDNLTPQVAQAVREAVQQELAMQRRELLRAQEAATNEIAALVHRLDELQIPMQERLHTYETRIQTLEKELALRNEENRELLKLKIETTTRQLEAERAANLLTPYSA